MPSGSLFDSDTDTASSHTPAPKDLGPYPGTVAVTLWGLDTIKTKGESVAILLAMVGAEPVREVLNAHTTVMMRCAVLCCVSVLLVDQLTVCFSHTSYPSAPSPFP